MSKWKKAVVGRSIVGAVLGGSALGLSVIGAAFAATDVPGTTSTSAAVPGDNATPSDGDRPDRSAGGHIGTNGTAEKLLSGDTAAQVTAAVTAAHPDSTVLRVENDAEGAAYEAHVTQADGTDATMKRDANFTVTGTETGHGHGGQRTGQDTPPAARETAEGRRLGD